MSTKSNRAKSYLDINGEKVELGEDFEVGKQFDMTDIFNSFKQRINESKFNKLVIKTCNSNNYTKSLCNKLVSENDVALYLIYGLATLILLFFVSFVLKSFAYQSENNSKVKDEEKEEEKIILRDFTYEQLKDYNGENNEDKLIYIALKGEVFDVTSAREMYGPGSGYHCFAGKDASRAMAKMSFDEKDLNDHNLDDLSPFEKDILNDWIMKYKYYRCYPIVGKVSEPYEIKNFTTEELAIYKGFTEVPENRVDSPIYMGINGKVIDVSYGGKEMYGEGGPYHIFAGIDASRALAKMSFSKEELNSRDLTDLSANELKTLHDWENKFINVRKYPIVGYIV